MSPPPAHAVLLVASPNKSSDAVAQDYRMTAKAGISSSATRNSNNRAKSGSRGTSPLPRTSHSTIPRYPTPLQSQKTSSPVEPMRPPRVVSVLSRHTPVPDDIHRRALPLFSPSAAAPTSSGKSICPILLQNRLRIPLNQSPFDTTHYVPMLPEVAAKHQGRVSLALDIDETLVHSMAVSAAQLSDVAPTAAKRAAWVSEMRSQCDLHLHLHAGTPKEELIFVRFRPGVRQFLQFAAERFEVIIFTASQRSYADPLMDALDPTGLLRRDLRLYREHCADVGGVKVKDLTLLGRPLPRVALVDNLASSFMFQPRNGIHIRSWYGEKADTELFTLMDVLRELSQASAVHDVLDVHHARLD